MNYKTISVCELTFKDQEALGDIINFVKPDDVKVIGDSFTIALKKNYLYSKDSYKNVTLSLALITDERKTRVGREIVEYSVFWNYLKNGNIDRIKPPLIPDRISLILSTDPNPASWSGDLVAELPLRETPVLTFLDRLLNDDRIQKSWRFGLDRDKFKDIHFLTFCMGASRGRYLFTKEQNKEVYDRIVCPDSVLLNNEDKFFADTTSKYTKKPLSFNHELFGSLVNFYVLEAMGKKYHEIEKAMDVSNAPGREFIPNQQRVIEALERIFTADGRSLKGAKDLFSFMGGEDRESKLKRLNDELLSDFYDSLGSIKKTDVKIDLI